MREISRARKSLNLRVPEKWIQERREAMALCGCTNLSEWIRTMVEEGETHALVRSMSHPGYRICSKCAHWMCVDARRLLGECMEPDSMAHARLMRGEDTCVEWRERE